MIDYNRLREILKKIDKKIILKKLTSISPLAVPIILEINRENLSKKETDEYILEDLENEILKRQMYYQLINFGMKNFMLTQINLFIGKTKYPDCIRFTYWKIY